jgi:hypothetical protein
MIKLFRYVVVISTILMVVYWLLPFVDHLWLKEEELNLAGYDGWGASIPNNPIIYWGLFTIWLTISVSLFFLVPIARSAFVAMQVITLTASFFWGFMVLPPISATVGNIVAVSDGVLLAMLFLTSVGKEFEKST